MAKKLMQYIFIKARGWSVNRAANKLSRGHKQVRLLLADVESYLRSARAKAAIIDSLIRDDAMKGPLPLKKILFFFFFIKTGLSRD